MKEFNPTLENAKKAEEIRKKYIEKGHSKIEQLKMLDQKVRLPGMIIASVMGALGTLVMGAGMATVMVWNNLTYGLILGIPGMIVALLAYPVYCAITGSRRKKYAKQILMLSDEIMEMGTTSEK